MPRRRRRPKPPKTPTTTKPKVPTPVAQPAGVVGAAVAGLPATKESFIDEYAQYKGLGGLQTWLQGQYYMGGEPGQQALTPMAQKYMGTIPYAMAEEGVWQQGANIFGEAALHRMPGYLQQQAVPMGVGWPTVQQKTDVAELMRYKDLLGRQGVEQAGRALRTAKTHEYKGPELKDIISTDYFKYITQGPHMPKWSDYPSGGGNGGGYSRRFTYRRPSYAGGGRGSVSPRTGLVNWRIGL